MAGTQSEQLLCVHVGDQEFALRIRAMREIRGEERMSPTALP
jgi:chemotaxis signal transduction protein